MSRIAFALLVLTALTTHAPQASAQADTTRRRDTTRTPQPQDSTRRIQEARGEIDVARSTERFGVGHPNFGFSREQASELQQTLRRSGCDVGATDGVVGQRTLVGIQCFRDQRNLGAADFESVLTALNVSFARPAEPPPQPAPEPPPPRLPPVLRPDSNYRPDVIARRDSVRRDSVHRDSVRRDSVRRDSTRRDTTRRP